MIFYFLASLFGLLLSFLVTLLMLRKTIPFFYNIGLNGKDMNKPYYLAVADGGGLVVVLGFLIGAYIALIISYFFDITFSFNFIHSTFLSLLLLSLLGFLEDLTNLIRSKNHKKRGFRQIYKLVIPLPASLPVVLAVLSRDYITLPFIGPIHIGYLYPLILVPIGIIGASNATNLLGGLNGLEGLLSLISFSAIAIYSWHIYNYFILFLSLSLIGSITAFLLYNWYPAKVFPGDSFTYFIGGSIAILSILGDFERFAIFLMLLWFIEFILKLRSKFKAECFGKPLSNGALQKPYDYIYSLTHIFMNGKRGEKQIVLLLALLQFFISVIALIIYW